MDKPGSIQIDDQAAPVKNPMQALQVNHVHFSQLLHVVQPEIMKFYYSKIFAKIDQRDSSGELEN